MEHALLEFLQLHADSRLAHNDDQIMLLGNAFRMLPHDFLHEPPHPVPDDGIPDFLACRDAQSNRIGLRLTGPIYDELAVRERLPVSINAAEVFAAAQSQFSLHVLPSPNLHPSVIPVKMKKRPLDVVLRLRAKHVSAFLAAGAQYFTSVFRRHPLAESVYFLPFADVRSKCRFHVACTSRSK